MFGLPDDTFAKFKRVFEKHPEVKCMLIYGSRAIGNYREGSDIDLSLSGKKISPELVKSIARELDGLNSPYLIDLSHFESLAPASLKEHIERVGKIFYKIPIVDKPTFT